MKNTSLISKLAAVLGALAVLLSLVLMYSHTLEGDPTGPITKLFINYIYSPTNQAVESTIKAVGTFDINEQNVRNLLTNLIIFASLASGVLAIFASRKDHSSFWYSVAIALSSAALMKLNTLAAIVFLFIFGFICLRNRKWKMTHF